ncbi:YkvA family protein [Phenylobacterium sp.]|uniref:YkvA family protein n=1 Tax=Phenylobacterium sp. TaxID=1871053 RepID=UPI002E361290|nr:YkvA family protein [Phenylobacterium sp.]HEX2559603.1 YkvA family protein [Phenylobacterium sp.]
MDPSRALVPAVVQVNEERVRQGFWPKLRKVATRIPFASDVVSVWYCARDPDTPTTAKGMMLAALAYFVLPTDAIPDVLAMIGYTDDAAVIAALMALVGSNVKIRHRMAAKAFLERIAREP